MCSLSNFADTEELRKIFSSWPVSQVTKIILALANPGSGYCQLEEDRVYSHSWHMVLVCSADELANWDLTALVLRIGSV